MSDEPDWLAMISEPGDDRVTRELNKAAVLLASAAYDIGKSHGPDWRTIAEAPRDGTNIIATGHNGDKPKHGRWMLVAYWSEQDDCWASISLDDDAPHELYSPTHYMPLPPAPETKE